MIRLRLLRIVAGGVFAYNFCCFPVVVLATEAAAKIEISASADNRWLFRINQNVPGPKGWQQRVNILIPRGEPVVPVAKIVQYESVIDYNNGDSSSLKSIPPFGFLLFGSDSEGATVEIRLVELFDKRDLVASSINGVYHFAYPK
jgi:hypothetical protein